MIVIPRIFIFIYLICIKTKLNFSGFPPIPTASSQAQSTPATVAASSGQISDSSNAEPPVKQSKTAAPEPPGPKPPLASQPSINGNFSLYDFI